MSEAEPRESQVAASEASGPQGAPGGRRWWYSARMVAFGGLLVSQLMGLASHRTGDMVRLRVVVIVLAGVFLIATTVDYGSGRKAL